MKFREFGLVVVVAVFVVVSLAWALTSLGCGDDIHPPIEVTVEPIIDGIELEGFQVDVFLPEESPIRPYTVEVLSVSLRAMFNEFNLIEEITATIHGTIYANEAIILDEFNLKVTPLSSATTLGWYERNETNMQVVPTGMNAGDNIHWWWVRRGKTDEDIRLGVGIDTTGIRYKRVID